MGRVERRAHRALPAPRATGYAQPRDCARLSGKPHDIAPLLRRSTITPPSAAGQPSSPPQPAPAVPPATPRRRWLSRLLWLVGLLVLAGAVAPFAYAFWSQRLNHSITEDAFVEAHIVNVAPQSVSGHIV